MCVPLIRNLTCPPSHRRLEVPSASEGEPDFAALVFYDEITRGDAFLCEWRVVRQGVVGWLVDYWGMAMRGE